MSEQKSVATEELSDVADTTALSVGVSLSGGGHRASAWGLGVFEALICAGIGSDVTSVTSVSGGSITNAVVADKVRLGDTTVDEFRVSTAQLREVIGGQGMFFPGPATDGYVRLALALVGAVLGFVGVLSATLLAAGHSSVPFGWFALAGLLPIAIAVVARSVVPLRVPFAVAGIVTAAVGVLFGWWLSNIGPTLWWLPVLVAVCVLIAGFVCAVLVLARRGEVLGDGLDSLYFDSRPLSVLGRSEGGVGHDVIIAAADLESGDSLYLSPCFVASYRRGIAREHGVSIADAVRASAAFPGAFPPVVLTVDRPFERDNPWIRVPSKSDIPERMPLADGGVYDNMGEQWDVRRVSQQNDDWENPLKDGLGPIPNLLIVANASATWEWKPMPRKWWRPLTWEIDALKRDQGIQYDQSTATRRRMLINTFRELRRDKKLGGRGGVLVMIDRSPFRITDAFAEKSDAAGSRAVAARDALAAGYSCPTGCGHERGDQDCNARKSWNDTVKANSAVPTVLRAIGHERMESIISQARITTLVHLYVVHNIGTLEGILAS